MAMSYLSENEAPRDFRVSSIESDGHYTKCPLCYTVKRNFYCADCVKSGNLVHSSMPYSERFADKQTKLVRLKLNHQQLLDCCDKLLSPKLKKDILVTENKRSKDKLELIRLAIDQRRSNINVLKAKLTDLVNSNKEMSLKLPKYQKRVASLGEYAQNQQYEVQRKINTYNEQAQSLAELRRSRVRQLNRYIFSVYISYDASDSIEDLEFVGDGGEQEPPSRPRLHIVAPYIDIDGDDLHIQASVTQNKEVCMTSAPCLVGAHRASAALGFCAQLTALLAWTLDVRLPHAVSLSECVEGSGSRRGLCRRLRLSGGALCAHALIPPDRSARGLASLHAIALAAAADDPAIGRVEQWSRSDSVQAQWEEVWEEEGREDGGAGSGGEEGEDAEPEHLHWPDTEKVENLSSTPPAATSLVTSAIASIWRGWTK